MNQSFGALKRVFDLINKTGDRCIILSPDSDEAYAVMSLAEYERLALGRSQVSGLTEDELLDKINRDIAIWKSQQEEDREAKAEEEIWAREATKHWERESEDRVEVEDEDWDEDYEEDPYYFEKV